MRPFGIEPEVEARYRMGLARPDCPGYLCRRSLPRNANVTLAFASEDRLSFRCSQCDASWELLRDRGFAWTR